MKKNTHTHTKIKVGLEDQLIRFPAYQRDKDEPRELVRHFKGVCTIQRDIALDNLEKLKIFFLFLFLFFVFFAFWLVCLSL
jgi:hypothetical protein